MTRREDLIGYLLGALDDVEHQKVEAEVRADPHMQDELRQLKRAMAPLEHDREPYDPPPGLADRTVQFVERYRAVPKERLVRRSRMRPLDAFATTTALAAIGLLVFPALLNSQFHARIKTCQNNLYQLGTQLVSYSEQQPDRSYPPIPDQGKLAFAGSPAIVLRDQHWLDTDSRAMICPDDTARQRSWGGIPTRTAIHAASGDALRRLQQQAGGSYGWYLGVIANGRFQAPRHQGRSYFVVLSDAPSPTAPNLASRSHGQAGWNVLYDDLHVEFVKVTDVRQSPDDPLRNHLGLVAAGVGGNDSVVAPSGTPVRIITSIMLRDATPRTNVDRYHVDR